VPTAVSFGERYLEEASASGLDYQLEYLRLALASAQARSGRGDAAVSGAEQAIARFTAGNISGLSLGWAYETRARIALALRDIPSFDQYAALTARIYLAHKNPPLTAKYDRLVSDANWQPRAEPVVSAVGEGMSITNVPTVLLTGRTPEERASIALSLLIEHSRTQGGFLFSVDGDSARCIARSGDVPPTSTLLERAYGYLAEELGDTPDPSGESSEEADLWRDADGQLYRPVALCHYASGELIVTGVAALNVDADKAFVYPAQLASDLSKYASATGNTTFVTQHP
jgi:hypothetical protein